MKLGSVSSYMPNRLSASTTNSSAEEHVRDRVDRQHRHELQQRERRQAEDDDDGEAVDAGELHPLAERAVARA